MTEFIWPTVQANAIYEDRYLLGTGQSLTQYYTQTQYSTQTNFFYIQDAFTNASQSPFTCSELTIETLEQSVKYVQS